MSTEVAFPRGGTEKANKKIVFDEEGGVATQMVKQKKISKPQSRPAGTGKITKAKKFSKVKNKVQSKADTKPQASDDTTDKDKTGEPDAVTFIPERLSTKKVIKGTLILGAVREIRDYEIRVNLPNNLLGCISITNMADGYTSLLKRFAQSVEDPAVAEELCSLGEIFTVGQILPCVCVEEAHDSQPIQLTINPKVLHEKLTPHVLRQGLVLYGAVNGLEDHGCQIDIGMGRISAFMPTEEPSDLRVGMIRRFRVTQADVVNLVSGDARVVTVTLQTASNNNEELMGTNIQFNSIIPGSLFHGKVYSRKTEGLVVKLGAIKGYAHVSHLSQHVRDFSTGVQEKFRVLSVNTATKYIHLTGLPSLVADIDQPASGAVDIPLGEPVQTTLSKIVDKYAFMATQEGHVSYMGISLLPDKMQKSTQVKDTKLKCFWFGWDYLEQRPIFSTKQPNVKKSILPTLNPGDDIEAKIDSIGPQGAKVKLASGFFAFIPNIHLTEVPLKNPEKKLKVGQKLQCKVLSVDMVKKRARLTCKPSFINSKLPVLSNLNDAKVGSLVQGVIVKITTGALISFYNNVSGFVNVSQLAKERIEKPSDVFYIGQSVTCRVLSCNPESDRLALTFILDGEGPASGPRKRRVSESGDRSGDSGEKKKRRERQDTDEVPEGTPLSVGQMVTDWSVLSENNKGFQLLSGEGHRALLPKLELSDFPGVSEIVSTSISAGSTLKHLVCISENPNIVSNKLIFKYYAAKDGLAKNWDHVQVDRKYPGSVISRTAHGMFINLGNKVVGLAPSKTIPEGCESFLSEGKSVIAKVSSLDVEKKRLIVRLRSSECSLPNSDKDLVYRMFTQHLEEIEQYRQWAQTHGHIVEEANRVSGYKVGQIVQGEVTDIDDDVVCIELEDGVEAIAKGDLTTGCTANIGDIVSGVVMYTDMNEGKLHVLLDKHYIDACKGNKSQADSNKAKVGQTIRCEIVYTRPEYLLAMLKGHAKGKLAYISTFQHPNAEFETLGAFYGQENKVTIKKSDEEKNMIVAELLSEREQTQSKAEQLQTETGLPANGSLVDAVISSIGDLQLDIKIKEKAIGRVYVNEISDDVSHKTNPLQKYKVGQKVQVMVIGARLITTNYKLRTIKDSGERVMLECSLRQSRMLNWTPIEQDMEIGNRYTCYVTKHNKLRNTAQQVNVVTSDGKVGVVSWYNSGEKINKSSDMISQIPLGTCLHTQLVAFSHDGTPNFKVIESETEDTSADESATYSGMVEEFLPNSGLIVSTSISSKCKIPLSELSEPGEDLDMSRFEKGLVVSCRLVKKGRHGRVIMTQRKKPGLMKLDEIRPGNVLHAIVSSISPDTVSVMAAGHIVKLTFSPIQYKHFTKTHQNGKACWIQITSAQGQLLAKVCEDEDIIEKAKAGEQPSLEKAKTGKQTSLEKAKTGKQTSLEKAKTGEQANLEKDETREDSDNSRKSKTDTKTTASVEKTETQRGTKRPADKEEAPAVKVEIKEELTDQDTGIQITFTQPEAGSKRQALDFGASVRSLQKEPEVAGNTLETCLNRLEQAGKHIKHTLTDNVTKSKTAVPKGNDARLAVSQTQVEPGQPESEAEFLSILKSNQDNGKVWARLIAFTSEHKGVDAARARAEQALQTVSYRMENEKLLVWSSFLALELIYGTEDTLDNVKRRALQQMNELKVYQELIKVYLCHDKIQEIEKCYTVMLRKWSDLPIVWIEYGHFFFSQNKLESGRNLLQRALKTLPNKHHIEIIMKFGQMELKAGYTDRFVSLFESMLTNFPKRTDIWSVYVDQLIKQEQFDTARSVLRRAVMQKLNAKKIQFFLKKFTDLETEHGTEEGLAEVKELTKTIAT